jgi:hypothetical protein
MSKYIPAIPPVAEGFLSGNQMRIQKGKIFPGNKIYEMQNNCNRQKPTEKKIRKEEFSGNDSAEFGLWSLLSDT